MGECGETLSPGALMATILVPKYTNDNKGAIFAYHVRVIFGLFNLPIVLNKHSCPSPLVCKAGANMFC